MRPSEKKIISAPGSRLDTEFPVKSTTKKVYTKLPSIMHDLSSDDERTLIPCASSSKDLKISSNFCDKLNRRLNEEKMDVHSSSRMKMISQGMKYLANGNYGVGLGSYNPERQDSRSRKRKFQKMNLRVRQENLQKYVK